MIIKEILGIFNSDMFDNDVWCKIDHIQYKDNSWTTEELLDIYDNMGEV